MNKKYAFYESVNRVGYITLNRPEKRNALNPEIVQDLKDILDFAEKDDSSKVIVLKANGDAFCAGADLAYLKTLQNNTYEENLKDSNHLKELFARVYTFNKVIIAQVEGHAIAGGGGLASVCDFVFSVSEAKFGFTEVKIGFVPAIISPFIIRKIGESKAKELLLTGDLISANEAKKLNLINYVVDSSTIKDNVISFAEKLIDNTSGDSLMLTKKLIADIQSMNITNALDYAAELNAEARRTVDCKKGISAFIKKEKIIW